MSDSISPFVVAEDSMTGGLLHVRAKAFIRGLARDDNPQVAIVVKSPDGGVAAVLNLNATDAHILSEQIRREAELVAVIEEENNK